MDIATIDVSANANLEANFQAVMRSDPVKIVFTKPYPQYQRRAVEAGIIVEVMPQAGQ